MSRHRETNIKWYSNDCVSRRFVNEINSEYNRVLGHNQSYFSTKVPTKFPYVPRLQYKRLTSRSIVFFWDVWEINLGKSYKSRTMYKSLREENKTTKLLRDIYT